MTQQITYFFSLVSPWAFIGHEHFMDMAARNALAVEYRPMDLLAVFGETGGVPLPKRHPSRLKYRSLELQRWRAERGLEFNLKPKVFPFNPSLADRLVIAQIDRGEDPEPFIRSVFSAIWREDKDLAEDAVLRELLARVGRDPDALMARAESEEIKARYGTNTREAVEGGVFGSPCYIFQGEHFWGQDRIEMLERAVRSKRPPIRPAV
jgi:2-hydroxychromene-2-carboxylate isomerase